MNRYPDVQTSTLLGPVRGSGSAVDHPRPSKWIIVGIGGVSGVVLREGSATRMFILNPWHQAVSIGPHGRPALRYQHRAAAADRAGEPTSR
jgi:hypothetical protein